MKLSKTASENTTSNIDEKKPEMKPNNNIKKGSNAKLTFPNNVE